MNEIVQHVPAFVDIDAPPRRANFDSLAQLLEVPFVKMWAAKSDFHRLSCSDNCLIAEQSGGRSWRVVGFLREHVPGLPKWARPDQAVELSRRVEGFEFSEENCPGHVAAAHDPKVCGRCGVHVDSFRPDEQGP